MKRTVTRTLNLAIVAAIIGGVVYFTRFAPVPADSVAVERAAVVEEVLGTGSLEARVSAMISSKISGRLRKLHVDQGDTVAAAQLLAELEDDELLQQVAIAEANREAAVAAMARLKADKQRAVAVSDQAQRSFDRVEILRVQEAISEEEADKASESLAVAGAGVALAEAAINEGQKVLIAAEKTLEYQQARLADTKITAPFPGLVVRRTREAGDVVVPGSQILSLIATEELWISAWVDETAIPRLQVDQPARIVFRSEPDKNYSGVVARLGRETDRETREFIVDVRILELPENWAVGQRAEVYIEVARNDDCLTLPPEFLSRREGVWGVQQLVAGKARWQPVQIGLQGMERYEILDGLKADDIVLRSVAADKKIPDGRAVRLP